MLFTSGVSCLLKKMKGPIRSYKNWYSGHICAYKGQTNNSKQIYAENLRLHFISVSFEYWLCVFSKVPVKSLKTLPETVFSIVTSHIP